ncbi:CobW family GTP-binding protein [Pseudothauera rhizosphaerae]|uniref:GTP-binding protein n=1 Tax=Pseudothauera rhizosphaerae TaxID=2565932 RepID=A0A4V3WAI4_9RHOO|nr:GTP-binding protein [Pseudothauera rhizosphaerae]THF59382.1 GTP-binding protein [Pseudothauera rhizosphaerae]
MAAEGPAGGAPERRIPVTVLTGFLGAGKTTLLNWLLAQPGADGAAVLINEFGEVGVDHLLVEKVDETLVLLDSGCLCCSVQGDLVRALKDLFMRALRREIRPFSRVLIETTGLADPAPVIHTLMEEPFIAERYRCDGVVTAVDATHALDQLGAQREAVRQVAMADRLLLTKCDLADADARAALAARLAELNPAAPQIEVHGGVPAAGGVDALFGCGLYDAAGKLPDVAAWLGEEKVRRQEAERAARAAPMAWRKGGAVVRPAAPPSRHDDSVTSYVIRFDEPLQWYGFADALGLILQVYGERILRVKGLLDVAGDPLPRVVQCVQHVAYPPSSLPAWPRSGPCSDRRSRLVFIVRELPKSEVEVILASLTGQAPAAEAA